MKISIVTPCFNSEKTIERTIQSVVNQKMEDKLEYIIIDGDSKDGTLRIIKKYAKKYAFIKYISEKDNCMTEALNKGMKIAKGDILTSINADDFYLDGALQKVVDAFKIDREMGVLMGNNFFVNEHMIVKSKNQPRKFTPLRCAFMECPFPECSVFFRRDAIERLRYFNEEIKYTQDFEMYLRQYKAGYKFKYKNIDVSCFVSSGTNYSSVISDKMNEEVYSYFKYKGIFKVFAQSNASKILKVLFGVRHYYIFKKVHYKEVVRLSK